MNDEPSAPSMTDNELAADTHYQELLSRISETYAVGQLRAHQAVNVHLTQTYWQIGHDIVEFEQRAQARAEYGKALLTNLSRDLTLRHGKGFSRSNVIYMRLLYLQYPKGQKPSDLLSWSHHVELLRIDDPLERSFYEKQAILEKWSVPELQQSDSSIVQRFGQFMHYIRETVCPQFFQKLTQRIPDFCNETYSL